MKKLLCLLSLLLPLAAFGQSGQPWSALRETLVLSNSWIQAVAVPGQTNYKFTIGTLITQITAQVTSSGSATNAVTRGENLALTNATTFGVFYRVVGQSNMQFFTIKAGTNIFIYRDGSNIVINSAAGTSGATVGAPLSSIQFNSNGVLQGSSNLKFTNGTMVVGSDIVMSGTNSLIFSNGTGFATSPTTNAIFLFNTSGALTPLFFGDLVDGAGFRWGGGGFIDAVTTFGGVPEATIRARAVRLSAGAVAGYVLTSDATGNATWAVPTASGSTFASGRRIIAYEGDSLVNQALPVWPRSMDSNSVWFARSDVETNWGANGDTLQNMVFTYATEAHLNRPTTNTDEGLFLLHAGFNDYPIGRIDSQLYGDMTNIWGQARADKYKVVAMPITGHTNLSAMVLSNLTRFDYLVRVDVMLANTNNTAMYYDTVHPTPAGANNISRAVAEVVDGKPWMLVNTREETNASIPMIMDLLLNPHGRYVGIGTPTPGATLHLRGTNAGQNILRIDHSDGTPRFRFGTHQAGDQYATIWGSSPVPNGTNYILSANTNATVVNAADAVSVNVGHVTKLYADSTGVYIPMAVGSGDHVAIRADGFMMRTNIIGGSSNSVANPISSVQFNSNGVMQGSANLLYTNNILFAQTFNVSTANVNFINLTNFLGSNQFRLGMQQLTNVSFVSLSEGHSLFWNATMEKFTNAVGGSGSGGSTQMVTAAIGTLTQTNDISFVVSNQANVGSWAVPAKTNYANAFSAQGGGTNRLGETIFDNNVSVTSNLTVGVMAGTGDHVAVNSAGRLMRTNLSTSAFNNAQSNSIPFLNAAGSGFTYINAYGFGSLTNPGFGFIPTVGTAVQPSGYGGLLVYANDPMGLVTIGHPNPGSDFSTFSSALVISNRYNSAADFKNDMVKFEAVMVGGSGGLRSDSTLSRWRVWQGTGATSNSSSNDVAEINLNGQIKLYGGTLYRSNTVALPTASELGAGGYWVGVSNNGTANSLVSIYSLNGSTTTMKVLVP